MVRCEILEQVLNRVITKATTPVHHYIGKSGTIQHYGESTISISSAYLSLLLSITLSYFGGAGEYLASDQNLKLLPVSSADLAVSVSAQVYYWLLAYLRIPSRQSF